MYYSAQGRVIGARKKERLHIGEYMVMYNKDNAHACKSETSVVVCMSKAGYAYVAKLDRCCDRSRRMHGGWVGRDVAKGKWDCVTLHLGRYFRFRRLQKASRFSLVISNSRWEDKSRM